MIYYLVFVYEAILCFLYDKLNYKKVEAIHLQNKKIKICVKKCMLIIFIIMPLWLVMGLRYEIGIDYGTYEWIFKQAAFYNENAANMEIGYYLLNRIVAVFSKNPQIIFLVVALLITILFVKAIIQNGGSLYYGILAFMGLGYYFYAMNVQRQYIAIGIMFYALKYLEQKNLKGYLICLIIGTCFHTSTILWLPLYFIVHYVPSKIFYVVSLGVGISINLLGDYVLNILINLQFYTNQIQNNQRFFESNFLLTHALIAIVFFVFCILFFKKLITRNESNNIRIKIIWLLFIIYIFLYDFGEAAGRIAQNMCPVYFYLLSDIVDCIKIRPKWITRVVITVMLFIFMYMILTFSGNQAQHFLPYVYRFVES